MASKDRAITENEQFLCESMESKSSETDLWTDAKLLTEYTLHHAQNHADTQSLMYTYLPDNS